MAKTAAAAKREARRKSPPPGTYWENGKELFFIVYTCSSDDVFYIEDCRTNKQSQMRRLDWNKCAMKEVTL